MARLMIYGAGYTGHLACEYASTIGLEFMCAGRNENTIKELASTLQVQYRIFSVDNGPTIDSALEGIHVLLNCAGPFAYTAKPLIDACIRNEVHYLDISAELDSYRYAEDHNEEASRVNVMLLPGCGGSVAMLGCLVSRALKSLESPVSIEVALRVAGSMSRGSAISATESLAVECLQRLGGELVPQDVKAMKNFDFDDGRGDVSCFPITLPDLVTIWKSNGVPTIKTFVHASENAFPTGDLKNLPDGPMAEEREMNPYHSAVVVTMADGKINRAALHTANGYTFTSMASVEAARRVLDGQAIAGFQTPVLVFGDGFFETVPGSTIRIL